MKNTTKKKNFILIAAAAVLLLLIAGCGDWTVTITYDDYEGSAVNVKAAGTSESYWKDSDTVTLEGAVVSLYAYDSTTEGYSATAAATATVGSTGSFTFLALEPAMYKLTAVKSGWTFVPRYIEITGSGADFPDLMAYVTDDAGQITIITSWENTTIDVDSILTYGEDVDVTPTDWTSGTANPGPGVRNRIGWEYPGSTSGIVLDRDVASDTYGSPLSAASIPRVETMTIYNSDWLTSGDVIYFYVDSYFDDEEGVDITGTTVPYQSLTGLEGTYASPYAQVDVMFGTEHYGSWVLPWNTAEDTLKIFRIDYNTAVDDTITGSADFALSSDMSNADAAYGGIKSIIWE